MSLSARRRVDAAAFRRATITTPARSPVIDATLIDDPANADEMLAWCLNYAHEGDIVTIHSEMCRTHLGCLEPCTCTPVAIVVGARA